MYVWFYGYMYVCIMYGMYVDTCMYMCGCMFICMYALCIVCMWTHVYVYVWLYGYMYVCIMYSMYVGTCMYHV